MKINDGLENTVHENILKTIQIICSSSCEKHNVVCHFFGSFSVIFKKNQPSSKSHKFINIDLGMIHYYGTHSYLTHHYVYASFGVF